MITLSLPHQRQYAHGLMTCLSFFCVLLLAGCGKGEKQKAIFYPMDSLIDHQIAHLKKSKAGLKKTATLDGKSDTKLISPATSSDTIPWIHELAVFREITLINKPANEKAYLVDDNLTDPRSNLKVKAFTALHDSVTNNAALQVKYLRIYYQNSIDKVRRIEAEMDIETSLYESRRYLEMEFQDIHDTVVLTAYKVNGGQKINLGDTVEYNIQGVITIPNEE